MRRLALTLLLLGLLATSSALRAAPAAADGDPGSDVLVYQSLFLASDAGIPVAEQAKLGQLLSSASQAGFPVRVAIIAGPPDLGAITGLWLKPRAYARFLGLELSLAYKGRLIVVMPDGFGFNWPGHSAAAAYRRLDQIKIGPGGAGLAGAAQAAVTSLAAASGVKLRGAAPASAPTAPAGQPAASGAGRAVPGSSTDELVAIILVALLAALGIAWLVRRQMGSWPRVRARVPRPRSSIALLGGLTLVAGAAVVALIAVGPSGPAQSEALATNPNLDPGTPLLQPAPDFTLTDQFGRSVSLHSFRGKVVLLAFNDSECTTICPLTTTAMLDAKAMLGRSGSQVQLLGVDANPKATSLEDVLSYSQLHGMLSAWDFLTGSLGQLQRVWKAYAVEAAVQGGEIAHTPALFVIDPAGRERKLYMTQQSYAAVGQLGQLVAQEASRLLPGHPAVNSHLSYTQVSGIAPATLATLPRAGGGQLRVGRGRARLYAFFATWDRQVTGLAGGLDGLSRYSALAGRLGLPALDGVDEGSVEPPGALRSFLATLPHPLAYPVGVDRDGRLADGYEVQGLPWLVLVSARGHIAWYYSVAALGWPSTAHLIRQIREALARSPSAPSTAAVAAELAGSPAPLAKLHAQADRVVGGQAALLARIRALRGYPIVVNVWGSWCGPCVAEFGLFGTASARYGRQVAFLGADIGDSVSDGQTFMQEHPVSYPSYQTSPPQLTAIIPQGLLGTPTTIFINRQGKLAHVHSGQYVAQGSLDGDIQTYALGG